MHIEALKIRAVESTDAQAIAAIYNHYVRETIVTFEVDDVTEEDMRQRIEDVRAVSLPWLVAETVGEVVGYAYATRWKKRPAYRLSVEITVYLAHDRWGLGIGTALYEELFRQLAELGLHAVIGGIALPNDGSVALHEKFGMKQVAHFKEVGYKFDRWIDVGYWQRTI